MPASYGYIGYTKFTFDDNTLGDPRFIRATSVDLALNQSIEKPDVIDSRFDKTIYQMGPKEVEGGISFPAFHDTGGNAGLGLTRSLWLAAIRRTGNDGDMRHKFTTRVKYAGQLGHAYIANPVIFDYCGCAINNMGFSIDAEGSLDVNMDVIGIRREPVNVDNGPIYDTRNSRIVTWNDVVVGFKIFEETVTNKNVSGCHIQNFSLDVANNIERVYTLNQKLFPAAIIPSKREITGSMTTLGRLHNVGLLSETNEFRCSEFSNVMFGYRLQGGGIKNCEGQFFLDFPGVVFEIENMSLSPGDLFTTEINFHVLPGSINRVNDNNDVQPFDPDRLVVDTSMWTADDFEDFENSYLVDEDVLGDFDLRAVDCFPTQLGQCGS